MSILAVSYNYLILCTVHRVSPQITENSLLPLIIIPQQSQHFLLTEGSSIEFYSAAAIANAEANPGVLGPTSNYITTLESQSCFPDESKLDALTTHAHMLVMLEYIPAKNVMTTGSTNGRTRMVVASSAVWDWQGHRGYGPWKRYCQPLKWNSQKIIEREMCLMGSPEVKNSAHRMAAHAIVEGTLKNLANEYASLGFNAARTCGAKEDTREL
jgi:hypothetical protein